MEAIDKTILAVLGSHSEAELIELMLTNMEEQLEITTNCKEAYQKIQSKEYDLILLDTNLPDDQNFSLLEKTRRSTLNGDTRILALAYLLDKEKIVQALKGGAADYIAKPYSNEELLLRLRLHLQASQDQKKLKETLRKNQQFQRKLEQEHKLYNSLFESAPIPIWEEDFSEVKRYFDRLRSEGVTDLDSYLKKYPEEVMRISELVKVVNINYRTVKFYKENSKEDVIQDLASYFTQNSIPVFHRELVALWNGETEFSAEIEIKVKGKLMMLSGHVAVMPDYAHDLSKVLFSFIDITEKKAYESEILRQKKQMESLLEAKGLGPGGLS